MGSALSCFEHESWDHTQHVKSHYKPAPEGTQDMTRPLPHYFISSGHNSYLEGNQLTSTAGTHTIELGLRHGCRVVELDCYDGPTEPVVTHGGTLTSTVSVHDCVKAVAKHGFAASPYPIILTIENHTKQQQAQMAQILRDVLGEHLFVPQPDQLARDGAWLSPEALKHKVVVRMKVKPGITDPKLAALVYIRNSSIKGYDAPRGPAVPSSHSLPDIKLPAVPQYAAYSDTLSTLFGYKTPQIAQQAAAAAFGRRPSAAARAASKGASSMPRSASKANDGRDQDSKGSTAAAVGSGGGGAPTAGQDGDGASNKLRSFKLPPDAVAAEEALQEDLDDTLATPSTAAAGEDTADLATPDLASVLAYTSRHLLRVYPNALRMVDNSNYNPTWPWACGISLAALNWQLWDRAIWINEAFFSRHHHSGYILKPEWMTTAIPEGGLPEVEPKTLSAKVYSAFRHQGRRVSVWKDDLYVELQVVGVPQDLAAHASPHKNNTARLVVDQTFDFTVHFPELAVLLVLLKDQDHVMSDTVLGYAALPLATLAPGAYQLRLADPKKPGGVTAFSHMWVKLEMQWKGEQEQQQGAEAAAAAPAHMAAGSAAAAAAGAAPGAAPALQQATA